jgi:hypothetical protein
MVMRGEYAGYPRGKAILLACEEIVEMILASGASIHLGHYVVKLLKKS